MFEDNAKKTLLTILQKRFIHGAVYFDRIEDGYNGSNDNDILGGQDEVKKN
jgi:hypothetical protein